ncbi:MAG: hypothetical protein KC502_13550 [Myxococcales bacterium]|nr:hypothetical protein [Myxococcales bacterium]
MSANPLYSWFIATALMFGALGMLGCDDPVVTITTLSPDSNPMTAADPLWSKQPHRDRPRAVCATATKAWVMLGGTEDAPGTDVVVVSLPEGKVLRRLSLAASPWSCALDPSERFLVVTLRYSDHAVVIDTATDKEVSRVAVPFYTEYVGFHPGGKRVFLTNRWKDAVLWWDVDIGSDFRVTHRSYAGTPPEDPMGTPAGENPTTLAFSADGKLLFVGSATSLSVAVIRTDTGALVDIDGDPKTRTRGAPSGISHIDFRSPIGGLAVHGPYLFIADIGRGTGSHPTAGRDLDGDGKPGDGTANVVFQDLGNEVAVVDITTFQQVRRYVADSTCCMDYRDVDPDQPNRGLAIPLPDKWSPDVVAYLPPKDRWIIAGALPQAMVVHDGELWVAYSGSNEVQRLAIGDGGELTTKQKAGQLFRTGFNPVAMTSAGGLLLTADRLGESLTVLDPKDKPGKERQVLVGDVTDGPFPSTDAELGEAINDMTAIFTIDGDQTCVHCHRENGSMGRPIVMPLQQNRLWGARNVMAQRGLYDTRPWFHESSMDETNFFPVLNEFTRKENFCCEGLDAVVWSKYPSVKTCVATPDAKGCNHVMNCKNDPPPECGKRPYAKTPFLRRSNFIKDAAKRLLGRTMTFGDALNQEQSDGSYKPIKLDFDGITRAIGLFMMRTPRLLPNPNARLNLPTAARGKLLFERPGVGCATCHPLPTTTTASLPKLFSPFGMPIQFPPVITPTLTPDGHDASQVAPRFIGTFPLTVQGPAGVHFGATPLRGLWDRSAHHLLHDGRAHSLREVLATPGHPVLRPGEVGRNERDGTFDSHGGTSHLDRYQVEDLINYLRTL